jgi:membrane-associated phospholipid phosphatase
VLGSVSARLGFVFIAIGLPGLLVSIVKRLIGRQRPNVWVFNDPLSFSPFGWDPALASLPSGHATTAFGTAVAIGALFPRLRWPLWIIAICVASTRVLVSTHYPSDILAGAVCGVLGALLVRNWFAARRLAFAVTPNGAVRAMPGPSARRLGAALRALFRR